MTPYGAKTKTMNFKKFFKPTLVLLLLTVMMSCSKDENDAGEPDANSFKTQVFLTDAPVDNAGTEAVFVTVADVKVNGKSLDGFQKTTVELSSLNSGSTELLGNVNLEAGTTSSIVLVMDGTTDASGESPGNYVLTSEGEKKAIATASNEINISDNAEIMASNDNELILDFDLRKSLMMSSDGEFSFVGNSQLSNSIRAVNEANTGSITGTFSNIEDAQADAVVVFAYEAGAYSEAEMDENPGGVAFSNAVTSNLVSESNGDFSLHFLEAGDYELHFISFSDSDNDGQLEIKGEMEVSTASEIELSSVSVDANSTTSLELSLVGLLNL